MKRLFVFLLILLALSACSRKSPTSTSTAEPIPTVSVTPLPSSTPTPAGSPLPRITIVPSATRLAPTQSEESQGINVSLTITATPLLSPSATPTPRIIDAGATATLPATPTLSDSPLPRPTRAAPESPLEPPPSATSPADATPTSASFSPTATTSAAISTSTAGASPTAPAGSSPSASPQPTPQAGAWRFEELFTDYNNDWEELYVSGEVVNGSGDHQRIVTLLPEVYDATGFPVTSEEDVYFLNLDLDYRDLLDSITLAPDQSLAFAFFVSLSAEFPFEEDNLKILFQAEPVEPARSDIAIINDDLNQDNLPYNLYVTGTYEITDSDLVDFVAIVVTAFDEEDRIVGMGWLYSDAPYDLTKGPHDFDVEIPLWEGVEIQGLDIGRPKIQAFGH